MAMDCPTCGRPNTDNRDFCECGEYLRWDPTGVLAAVPAPAAGVAAAPNPATPAPSQATQTPPTPVPAEPVVVTLRLPGAPAGQGPPTLPLAVTTPGLLQGVVRNQTRSSDAYTLRVDGLPPEWVEISPSTVDLLPYGNSSGGHESHFHMTITPPRSPNVRAGRHPFRLEAVSRATGAVTASAQAALEILPYHELELEALPEVRGGRRRIRFTATATAKGNAPLEVELMGRDREERYELSFEPPALRLEPTVPADSRLTVKARRIHWFGHTRETQLAVTAHAANTPPPPTQIVTARQRALIPFWFPPVLALLAAAVAAFVLTRPDTATMPALAGQTFNAGRIATARAGFTQPPRQQTQPTRHRSEIGTILRQEPAAASDQPRDARIVLVVGVGRERTRVPDLQGLDVDQAHTALRHADLTLGPVGGAGVIVRQSPATGERAAIGTGVTVALAKGDPKVTRPVRSTAPVSLAGVSRLAIADRHGISVAAGDAFRLNVEAGDSDPAWAAPDQVAFVRGDRLFVVTANSQATPAPLAESRGWRSPAAAPGALAAVRGDQVCVRVSEWKCRNLAGVRRIAWGSEGASLVALTRAGLLVRFAAAGDDPKAWPRPKQLGAIAGARDVAVSPEGAVVVSSGKGLERLGTGAIALALHEACAIDFLDATRLAVAAGACDKDAPLRLVDIESGATRALAGDKGRQLAFG